MLTPKFPPATARQQCAGAGEVCNWQVSAHFVLRKMYTFLHETIFLHAFVHSGDKSDKTWRAAAHMPTSVLVSVLAGGICILILCNFGDHPVLHIF